MEKELPNGMTITYVDESKKLAADRWLVKLRCRIAIPLQGWMLEALAGDDPETVYCLEQLGGRLLHEMVMERNFIDGTEKDRLKEEMIERLEDAVLGYLSKEAFVRQLFTVKLAEVREEYVRQGWNRPVPDAGDDTPEPDDFSACFR